MSYIFSDNTVFLENENDLELWNIENGEILKIKNLTKNELEKFIKQKSFSEELEMLKTKRIIVAESEGTPSNVENQNRGYFNLPSMKMNQFLNSKTFFDAVIAGIPYDLGVVTVPGCRFGPSILRNNSWAIDWELHENHSLSGFFNIDKDENFFRGKKIVDIGDVSNPHVLNTFSREDAAFNIEHFSKYIFNKGVLPIFVGGDHSITPNLIKGISSKDQFGIIQIDAHNDYAEYDDGQLLHNNILNKFIDSDNVIKIYQLGLRNPAPNCQSSKVQSFSLNKVLEDLDKIVSSIDSSIPYYISVDLDCLDPLYFPATGSFVPGGFTDRELIHLLDRLTSKLKIIGADFVEISPDFNSDFQRLGIMVSNIILRFLSNCLRSE